MKVFGMDEFAVVAKKEVYELAKKGFDKTDDVKFSINDVYIVWSCYILGNMKAMLSTNIPDGRYYEVTYNVAKKELYVDTYAKINNTAQYIECYK